MSSSSIARQNRRMRQRQLLALNSSTSSPLALSPNILGSNNLNSESYEISTDCSTSVKEEKTNSEDSEKVKTEASFLSTTGCSYIDCDVSSRPIGKVFIEEERGFKVLDTNNLQLFSQEHQVTDSSNSELAIHMAYKVVKLFQYFSLFCHGLLGGMSLIHLLLLVHLITTNLSHEDTITHFSFLSQPIHNIYNFICIICCISAFDRYDVGNIKNSFKYIKKCHLSICIVLIYPICLLMSLSTVNVDEKLWLHKTNFSGWETYTSVDADNEIFYWKTLSIIKCVGAILGWVLLSLDYNHNLFLNHLKDICDRNKIIK